MKHRRIPAPGTTRLTLTCQEVADTLGLGRNSVSALIAQGRLKGIRVGARVIVPIASVNDFIAAPDVKAA